MTETRVSLFLLQPTAVCTIIDQHPIQCRKRYTWLVCPKENGILSSPSKLIAFLFLESQELSNMVLILQFAINTQLHSSYTYVMCGDQNSLWVLCQLLKRTQQQAGFIYMAEGYFTEAASLMKEGGLDPREVITAPLSDR